MTINMSFATDDYCADCQADTWQECNAVSLVLQCTQCGRESSVSQQWVDAMLGELDSVGVA